MSGSETTKTAPQLPTSTALSEASPQSLSDLMAMDPERMGERELTQIVAAMRAQREREASAAAAAPERPRARTTIPAQAPSAEDLGF